MRELTASDLRKRETVVVLIAALSNDVWESIIDYCHDQYYFQL